MKRAFDLIAALAGLVLLSPLLAAVALAVAATSRGPVIFRQRRVGLHGEPFEILKFRTMTYAPPATGPLVTAAGDRRVTGVGRVLRAAKLDELPQLWNVVRGDMSLVGPRPEVQRYVELYSPEVALKVLSVRPGITDEASLAFRNESEILGLAADPERAYVEEILPEKLRLYVEYVDGRSFLGDIGIIARTLVRVVRR